MPLEQWPAHDRALWTEACRPAGLLDDEIGARASHAAISNLKAQKGYGRWLTHLSLHDPKALLEQPGERITRDRVVDYVHRLKALNNDQTILARLQELGEVARVMSAERSWSFINSIASRVRADAKPARSKSNMRLSHELADCGFHLIERTRGAALDLQGAIDYRDGLLVAFLALLPLRRRNLAALRLGQSLIQHADGFLVYFASGQTKTGAPLELELPASLVGPMQEYLKTWRPILLGRRGRWHRDAGPAVWVSKDGSAMTQIALYDRFRLRTLETFGEAMNPHLARDAAATTLAIYAPAQVRAAAPLLGHRTPSTTERHYQQATGLQAQGAYLELTGTLKEGEHG